MLPKIAEFYQQSAATIERLRKKHSGDPNFTNMAIFYTNLNARDQEGLELLNREVTLSGDLSTLPVTQRQLFYEEKIVPLHAKEDRIAQEEVNMAREAKGKGIPLPEDINRSISQ